MGEEGSLGVLTRVGPAAPAAAWGGGRSVPNLSPLGTLNLYSNLGLPHSGRDRNQPELLGDSDPPTDGWVPLFYKHPAPAAARSPDPLPATPRGGARENQFRGDARPAVEL